MTTDLLTTDLPLFALARRTDPLPSRLAAADLAPKLNALQARMASVIRECGPLTASEAAAECVRRWGGMSESYRKRAGELVRAGTVRVGDVRQCGVTGKAARTFVATPGEQA